MKIKLVQDSIVFISGLKREQLEEVNRFCPKANTLISVDVESGKKTPVCAIAYANEGSVSPNGIVFDSTTEDGFMCKTLVATQGNDVHVSVEDKIKALSEEFASLILNMNVLEEQIETALEENADKITRAKKSIEAIEL